MSGTSRRWIWAAILPVVLILVAARAEQQGNAGAGAAAKPVPTTAGPTHAALLRGAYGPYRANNDLLYYHLDVRVDPDKKYISGKNTIRFKMLTDGTRIQLDLNEALNIDKIVLGTTPL